ncbi:hypothetical protein Fcan01_20986 [Folsomia candida]|uniref:Uncharacterized protein n=1 Tax=Folsomia candida TaxID=158441 RepID=A0A226DGT7_FOLCA|nr:hypothetical protein Fcan01_20986 [Folsomia candida]
MEGHSDTTVLTRLIKRNLKYGDIYGCSYSTWQGDRVIPKSRRGKNFVRLTIMLHLLYFLAQICSISTATQATLVDRIEAGMISVIYFVALAFRWEFHVDPVAAQLLNYISNSPAMQSTSQKSTRILFCIGFILDLTEIYIWLWAIILAALTIFLPCKPPV